MNEIQGQDKAGNWGDWSCVTLKVYDRTVKISGVIAGRLLEWKDTAARLIYQYATEKMTPAGKARFRSAAPRARRAKAK